MQGIQYLFADANLEMDKAGMTKNVSGECGRSCVESAKYEAIKKTVIKKKTESVFKIMVAP